MCNIEFMKEIIFHILGFLTLKTPSELQKLVVLNSQAEDEIKIFTLYVLQMKNKLWDIDHW